MKTKASTLTSNSMEDISAKAQNTPSSDGLQYDWYVLTETSRSLLNSVIAATVRETMKLELDEIPDKKRLKYLENISDDAYAITQNGENFESLATMAAIIKKYKAIFHELQPVTA